MQEPWKVWRGFSDLSEVRLSCGSNTEEEERRYGKFSKIEK